MKQLALLLILSQFALLIGACATRTARPPVTAEQRDAFERAVASSAVDPAAGRAALEAFVRAWPTSTLADDAGMRLGMLSFEQRDRDAALRWFYFVLREHDDSELAEEARVRAATLEYSFGNNSAATELLSRARFSQLSRDQKRAAYRVLVSTAPDGRSALRWLARLRSEEVDETRVALVDAEIDKVLRTLPTDDFESAADQIGRSVPAARILIAAAERALDEGDVERASELLDRASRLPLAPTYAGRLASVSNRIAMRSAEPEDLGDLPTLREALKGPVPSTAAAAGTIGVVLPLTGPYAPFGLESLQGVLLAADLFEESVMGHRAPALPSEYPASHLDDLPSVDLGPDGLLETHAVRSDGKRIRLLIRDSRGEPERAVAAVRELSDHDEVTAIVGPLVRAACEAAAVEADGAGIPLVALSSREEVASKYPNVFRVRTRPVEEVSVLVRHAMEVQGAQTFAILYPDDAYGRGLRSLFWDAVERQGGTIVGAEPYRPDAVDFAEPIRRLVGFVLLDDDEHDMIRQREEMLQRARRLPVEEASALRAEARALTSLDGLPLPPIVDFDALFIPESHDKVVLIAPQLAFHEAAGMRLLGPSGWHHPELVSIGRKHVRNALVASPFFAESPVPIVEIFARRYESTFNAKPAAFAAQAYDAANLVFVQLANGLVTRTAVRDGVLNTRSYPGVSGVLSMGADGNARKRPFLLGIERGRFVEVE